ncbi:MAG: hypothetical protein AAF555_00130 [Verrucomicrobiota bacterium]
MSPFSLSALSLASALGVGVTAVSFVPTEVVEVEASPLGAPRAVLSYQILDDSEEWYRGRAELYLKVESTLYPERKILLPLNVGEDYSGQRNGVVDLPFVHPGETDETYLIELLENDRIPQKDEEKIASMAGGTGFLIWKGAKLYALSEGLALPDWGEQISKLIESGSYLYLTSLRGHWYQSYGRVEYHVPHAPTMSHRDANRLTIRQGKRARLDVKVHFTPAPSPSLARTL